MPKILKPPDNRGGMYADLFRDRPAFAIEVATIMLLWARTEQLLADFLVFMQGGDSRSTMAVYHSLGSLEIRLTALQSVAKRTLPEASYREFLKLAKEIRAAAKKRNSIAHAVWAENGFFPDGIIKQPHASEHFSKNRPSELWEMQDFVAVRNRLLTLQGRIRAFVYSVYQFGQEKRRQGSRQ